MEAPEDALSLLYKLFFVSTIMGCHHLTLIGLSEYYTQNVCLE